MAPVPPVPTLPPCARGLSAADLSAFRDGTPAGDNAAALDAHIAACPACRAQMEQFDQLASALRAERVPEPDERLWQAVRRAAEAESRRITRLPLMSNWRISSPAGKRPFWSGLGAVAAVLLLVLGFVQLFALHGASTHVTHAPTVTPVLTLTPVPTPTLTPIPALLPAHPLAWHPITWPPNASQPTIAPAGDGVTAYACSATSASTPLVWTTTDQGARWTSAQVVPHPGAVNRCELVVDQGDPSVAALCWVPNGGGAGDSCTLWMTTVDRGVTWQQVPYQSFVAYDQLDSRGGVIYAVRETGDASGSVAYHLWASRDRMRSWQQVDHGLTADVAGFWLQPDELGILAVLSSGANNAPSYLSFSPDGGATWNALSVPVTLPSYTPARFASGSLQPNAIVASMRPGQPVEICVVTNNPGISNTLTCSMDGGDHWQSRNPLTSTNSMLVVGIAGDGALLVVAANTDAESAITGYTLYRLAAGSDRWQPLGAPPDLDVIYCPGLAGGTLWAFPVPGVILDPQNRVFTAAYTP